MFIQKNQRVHFLKNHLWLKIYSLIIGRRKLKITEKFDDSVLENRMIDLRVRFETPSESFHHERIC